MQNLISKPMQSSQELSTLNLYHKQRNKAALKAVEEMSKHPLSYEQAKAQIARKYQRKEQSKKSS